MTTAIPVPPIALSLTVGPTPNGNGHILYDPVSGRQLANLVSIVTEETLDQTPSGKAFVTVSLLADLVPCPEPAAHIGRD